MKIPYKWSRDEAIELCLEALATGSVHGFSPNHDPDLLATDTSFGQNSNGDLTMWRDWGLFEAHFTRWQVGPLPPPIGPGRAEWQPLLPRLG